MVEAEGKAGSPTPDSGTKPELIRAIGTRDLAANIINLVVGAGIFVLPALVFAEIGAASFLAYLVCAVAIGLVFLCFAEIGSRVTTSGGAYAYVEAASVPSRVSSPRRCCGSRTRSCPMPRSPTCCTYLWPLPYRRSLDP